ncbi:MAG TPA: HAD-IA family hydrolase [Bryobacteraceae bacterium]|nr:HAD-IA family hydrolase [Bryobacteraceae bacterium]
MAREVIVFDMDGVLVDVTDSYRETIVRTVEHFAGVTLTHPQIQDYKNQGGFNDDWKLSHHAISRHGVAVEFQTVVDYFQGLFHGNGSDGLILRERWLARGGLFDRLAARFDLAIFTGRMRWEAEVTLKRFAPSLRFDPVVGMHEVAELKPAPEGLLKIAAAAGGRKIWYAGDTVDDARCARAAAVPFIGIASPNSPRRDELTALFQAENAVAVLEDLNQLESVLV